MITKSLCILLQCSPSYPFYFVYISAFSNKLCSLQRQMQTHRYILIISCSGPWPSSCPFQNHSCFWQKSSWICTGFLPWAGAKNLNLFHMKCFHNITQDWAPCIVDPYISIWVTTWHIMVLNCAVLWYVMFIKDNLYTEKNNATIVWQCREWG